MTQAQLLSIVPLIVILVLLLPPFRFHFLFAGLIGGFAAVLIGGLNAGTVTKLTLTAWRKSCRSIRSCCLVRPRWCWLAAAARRR